MTIARIHSLHIGRPAHRRAFTLIELLVVMGIIVLLIALALPAFRFITGSRSVESATNQLAAALSVARAQAIGVQQTRGVAIYRDPDNDRSVAALVELRYAPFPAWVAGSATVSQSYTRGQYFTQAGDVYVCLESYVDTAGTIQPNVAGIYWQKMPSLKTFAPATATGTFIELQSGADFIQLPTGVDARGVCNEFQYPGTSATDTYYRYVNPVVILFDANGQIVTSPFFISREGLLGQPIDRLTRSSQAGAFVPVPPPDAGATVYYYGQPSAARATPTVTSQIGLVLFDTEVYKNVTSNNAVDFQVWLDQNASPSMINRYNGTLVKGD